MAAERPNRLAVIFPSRLGSPTQEVRRGPYGKQHFDKQCSIQRKGRPMLRQESEVKALQPLFADMELRATEEYLRTGRYFVDETMEGLILEWNGAIIHMRSGRFGPGLLRSIVGVLGEFGLRRVPLPEGALREMNLAAAEAFATLDPDVKQELLDELATRVAASKVGAGSLH